MAVLMFLIFCALGAGNGSTFQLIPFRWPTTTPIAMSLVGEIGALGGGLVTNSMGQSKQHWGDFSGGFYLWAAIAVAMFFIYLGVRRRWTTSWVGRGGRALSLDEYEKRKAEGRLFT
jgi:NNP family nitrate/nitrite transporter-like MFS transporter